MAQILASRVLLLRAVEFAADGILPPGPDRRRCVQERRRGARDRCVLQLRAEYAGGDEREILRRAARFSPDRRLQVGRSGRAAAEAKLAVIPGHAKREPGISRFPDVQCTSEVCAWRRIPE